MAFIVTNLFNFIFLIKCIFIYHFHVYFRVPPTSDQDQPGKDAEHPVVVAAMKVPVLDEEDGCS